MDLDPALCELLSRCPGPEDREVEAIIRLDRPTDDVAGVRIVSRFGPVATCRLDCDEILATRRHPNVLSLKRSDVVGPEPDADHGSVDLPLRALDSDQRRPPGGGLTGAGVLLGVIDWGCDPDHPNLKRPDGTTRLVALWDQRDAGPGPAPSPYGYGTLHLADRIDAALATADPYGALGYHPADADRDGEGSHGMHVVDIAAGNGRAGGPVGIAPECDIAFVHLANRDTGGLANLGDSVRILEAVDFIFRLAGSHPCVINISAGQQGGPHDGRTLCEQALDHALQAEPNRFVCQSGGNYFGKAVHASGRIGPGEAHQLAFVTDEADFTPNELEVWYSGEDELVVSVESPTGERTADIPLGGQLDVVEDGRIVGRLYHRDRDPNNHDHQVDLFLYETAPAGRWVVTLTAVAVRHGVFHAWLERDQACLPCQAHFEAPDDRSTTGTIANGHLPLVVGAYDAHAPGRALAPFSSSGPTRDGRLKPDLVAPGSQILAGRSAPVGSLRSSGLLTRKSGTSMATPHVTGAVALCLQAATHPLTARQVRGLILGATTYPRRAWSAASRLGHGYLDLDRLMATLQSPDERKKPEMPVDNVEEANPSRDQLNLLTNTVFFARHPERQGARLSPDDPDYAALSKEWLQIRDTIAGPAAAPAVPAPAAAGPLAAVATPLPSGGTRNRYGIPETVEALTWITQEWARRHPDTSFRVRDISRLGGGQLGKHKSHRVGLDADVHLIVEGKRISATDPDFDRVRPLVQELVDVIRANPVLPVKTIGFLDPQMRGVDLWAGHIRHLHIRFCQPGSYTPDLARVYGPGESKPSYACGGGAGEAEAEETGHLDLYYEEEDEAELVAPTTKPRVVFLPGLMGTALLDSSLSEAAARRLCEKNLGPTLHTMLRGTGLYPCNQHPEALWGEVGALHWLFDPDAWSERMRSGNGLDDAGTVRPGSLLDLNASFLGKRFEFRPYRGFVQALQDEGFDVLEVPYDWRLSVMVNAHRLQRQVLDNWFDGKHPESVSPAEQVSFVGHSLGGLVARAFVESVPPGKAITRRLITIGTPHLGAPQAYVYLIDRMAPFATSPYLQAAKQAMALAKATASASVPPTRPSVPTLPQPPAPPGPTMPRPSLPKPAAPKLPSLPDEVLPAAAQNAVLRFMASTAELLPVYDFVEKDGRLRPYGEAYQGIEHTGTGKPIWELVVNLRRWLVPPTGLERWLTDAGIDYHFLAVSGYSTTSGYRPAGKRLLVTKDGDGTVPLRSAHPAPASGARLHQKAFPRGRLSHSRLCERADILAHCLDLLGGQPAHAAVLKRELQTQELVEATTRILAVSEKNLRPRRGKLGKVMSVVTLAARDGTSLIDIRTVGGGGGRPRLVNPPAGLADAEVHSVPSTRYGQLPYVRIKAHPKEPGKVGGVLFLPLPDEETVRLVTFNIGQLDRSYGERCKNYHHAEVQLEQWLQLQDVGWRENVGTLKILNTSRFAGVQGYSPCTACCGDLQVVPDLLKRPGHARPDATISWSIPYERGAPDCGHETTNAALGLLKDGGWTIQGPLPSI